MRLTLLQTKQNELYNFIREDLRFTDEQACRLRGEMVEQTFALMDQAPKSDLIVTTEAINFCGQPEWLENGYASYYPEAGDPLFARLALQAKKHRSYLAACCYVRKNGRIYNEALVFDRDGRLIASYDKIHLAPGSESKHLSAGESYCVIPADFGTFGVCVCWDMQFPETCRELALGGAQLVVCPTWGWEGVYGHARAYENGIFAAAAMGVPYWMSIADLRNPSEVVSPQGRVLATASRTDAQVLNVEIDLVEANEARAFRMACRRPDTYRHLAGGD